VQCVDVNRNTCVFRDSSTGGNELCRRKCDCFMPVDVDTKRNRPMKFAQFV
jgi:hypothetical protein